MKRIMAVCGSGLGSSFMVEMNITEVLGELGLEGEYEAMHTSLADVTSSDAEIFVTGKDLEESAKHLPNLIVLESLLDKEELKEKIQKEINK